MPPQELIILQDQRLLGSQLADYGRVLNGKGRHIQGIEQRLEGGFVLDIFQEVSHGHQADAVQAVADERVKIVAPLLAVRDDINAGVFLILDGQKRGFVL
jgi:hypothetical protein